MNEGHFTNYSPVTTRRRESQKLHIGEMSKNTSKKLIKPKDFYVVFFCPSNCPNHNDNYYKCQKWLKCFIIYQNNWQLSRQTTCTSAKSTITTTIKMVWKYAFFIRQVTCSNSGDDSVFVQHWCKCEWESSHIEWAAHNVTNIVTHRSLWGLTRVHYVSVGSKTADHSWPSWNLAENISQKADLRMIA